MMVRGETAVAAPAAVNPVNVSVRGTTTADEPAAVKPANVSMRGTTTADEPAAVKPANVMLRGAMAADEPDAVKPASVIVRGIRSVAAAMAGVKGTMLVVTGRSTPAAGLPLENCHVHVAAGGNPGRTKSARSVSARAGNVPLTFASGVVSIHGKAHSDTAELTGLAGCGTPFTAIR